MEFFITARSFAAPFVSDESSSYVEAETAAEALERFAETYSHPFGLYAAEAWTSADVFHKGGEPAALWLSNHERAKQQAAEEDGGIRSYLGRGPGDIEVNGRRIKVEDPHGGAVVEAG